nr:hypothetical protein [Tanacetum cinerariifolium]
MVDGKRSSSVKMARNQAWAFDRPLILVILTLSQGGWHVNGLKFIHIFIDDVVDIQMARENICSPVTIDDPYNIRSVFGPEYYRSVFGCLDRSVLCSLLGNCRNIVYSN